MCRRAKLIGCFNDTDHNGGNSGMRQWLPQYIAALHDKVTLENCASACSDLKLKLAGKQFDPLP